MIKETITYVDYNNVERTEDFFFNLSKAELMEIEMSTSGGLVEMINSIVSAQDAPAIIKVFKELILKAYGVKSLDGKRFEKSDKLRTEFEQTEAYSQLFMELSTDADAASKFVNGIMPSEASVIKKETNQATSNKVESLPVK